MKIHELAQKTGLTAPTIRFYEKEGLLDRRHVQRKENNYRDYCEDAIDQLLMIKKVQAAGFTLIEIKELSKAYQANEISQPAMIELIRKKMQEIDRKKSELEQIQMYLAEKLARKLAGVVTGENGAAGEEILHSLPSRT